MVTSHALLISVSSFSRASLRYNERPKPVLGVVGYPILGLPTRPPHNASALFMPCSAKPVGRARTSGCTRSAAAIMLRWLVAPTC